MAGTARRVLAIDGPAGAGKSKVARRVAEALGFAHLDTGAMYRAVTYAALTRGVGTRDEAGLAALVRGLALRVDRAGRVWLDGQDVTSHLRTPAVSAAVSAVSSVAAVRSEMARHQRAFAEREGPVVAEGRDMSTVVVPDAELKVYLDASPEERARRRVLEQGGEPTPEAVARMRDQQGERDRLDSTRPLAPLSRAPDAWYLDTTGLTLEEVVARVLLRVRSPPHPADGR